MGECVGECVVQTKQKSNDESKRGKRCKGGISTSLLCTTVTEKVASKSFEDTSSKALATE